MAFLLVESLLLSISGIGCSTGEPLPVIWPGRYALVSVNGKPMPAAFDSISYGDSLASFWQWVAGSIEVESYADVWDNAAFNNCLVASGAPNCSGGMGFRVRATLHSIGDRVLISHPSYYDEVLMSYPSYYGDLCGINSGIGSGTLPGIPTVDTAEVLDRTLTMIRHIPGCDFSLSLVYRAP